MKIERICPYCGSAETRGISPKSRKGKKFLEWLVQDLERKDDKDKKILEDKRTLHTSKGKPFKKKEKGRKKER